MKFMTIILLALLASYILAEIWDRRLVAQARRRSVEHARCKLAYQRIYYIGRLRQVLRKCSNYLALDTSEAAKLLKDEIHDLIITVNINGEPIERKANASNNDALH